MNIVEYTSSTRTYKTTLVPGSHVVVESFRDGELIRMQQFHIGDEAEYDSYNLHYLGRITSIGRATVTVRDKWGEGRRLKAAEFAWRNWDFDSADLNRRNAETSQHI